MSRMISAARFGANLEDRTFAVVAIVLTAATIALLVWLPFFIAGALLVAVVGAVLVMKQPVLLPIALIASVPVQDAIPIPEGVPLTATRAAVAAGLAVGVLMVLVNRPRLAFSWLLIPLGGFVAALILSLENARDHGAGYAEIYRWFVAILAFWLVIQFMNSRRQVVWALVLLAVLATAQSLIGAIQAVLGLGPTSFEVAGGLSRAYGTFGMPNSYAAYMESVTIPLIPVGIWSLSRSWHLLRAYRVTRLRGFAASASERRSLLISVIQTAVLLSGAATGLLAIALSFSRGGWLATAAALVMMIVLMGRRVIVTTVTAVLATTVGLVVTGGGAVVSIFGERITQLIEQIQFTDVRGVPVTSENFATIERMSHWQTAIAMWDQHPWLGIGVGNFDARFREFAVHPSFINSQGHAHNYYLHVLAETGMLGLSLYLLLLGFALWTGFRAFRARDPLAQAIGIGALGLTVALVVHNVFENLHVLNINVQIVAIWALAHVATRWTPDGERPTAKRRHRSFSSGPVASEPARD
jgi:O-antigen ligase